MHLVKWFRKNMTKLMAVFVILIMIAFIMPNVLNQLAKPRMETAEKAMWTYNDGKAISRNDIVQATSELTVMRNLFVDKFFMVQRDLKYALLGQLLFPDSGQAPLLSDQLKRVIIQNRLRISPERIDDFFEQAGSRAELFWILLRDEAKNAGCAVPRQSAGEILNAFIPRITSEQIDAQTAVQNAGQANHMTDDMVLGTFADLMAVIAYAGIMTDIEDVTEAQVASVIEREKETINAEFVELAGEKFLDKAQQPDEKKIAEQFEKYKNYYPNTITEENPYGFGYKQKPRVALEYAILKLEDIKKLVAAPTEEEAEEFYQQNLEMFTEEIREDANDPNSKTVQRQRSYAEVVRDIKNLLLAKKVNSKAVNILNAVVESSQADLDSLNLETATVEQIRDKTTDYTESAKKVEKENDVKIYTGKTGLVTTEDIMTNQTLRSLMMQTQSRIPTSLAKLAFATEQLGDEAYKLGPFEPAKPKMYISFGPLADNLGNIMAMVRVIDTKKSQVPQDINLKYEKKLPAVLKQNQEEKNVFVLKEKVKQDCVKQAAFDIAIQKANEFAQMAKSKGWDSAIEKFNSLYPSAPTKSAKDANENQKNFEIETWLQRSRLLATDIETVKLNMADTPGAESIISQIEIRSKLMDSFYSLFGPSETQLENTPAVVDFKPQFACYVIKSLSRKPATTEDYQQLRQQVAFNENYIESMSMAFEHFMPNNITKRLNLKATYEMEPNEPNAPVDGGRD